MQWLLAQRALKAVAGVLSTVGDHAHVKVVADAVGLGAIGDDGIEGLVEYIRQEGGLALSAVQAMIHRRRLIHHHQDRRRRRAADFGLVTQGPYPCRWPQPAITVTCARERPLPSWQRLPPNALSNALSALQFHSIEAI